MSDVFRIAEILLSHAVRVHGDEIAIIAYYGSHAKGQATPTSDLDIFYIPDDGKANSLSSQFIIDGLPYDFWGVPWSFAEDIANARSGRPFAVSASLIADAKVLYHRSPADLDRFNALQAHIVELTSPESRPLMVGKGLDEFKNTLFQLGQMRLAAARDDMTSLRWAGQEFVNSIVNSLALTNQTYFSKGWGANWRQVLAIPNRPKGLERLIEAVLTSQDADLMIAEAEKVAWEARTTLKEAQASVGEPAPARDVFKDFYYFVFEYKHKVLSACERKDTIAAGYAVSQMMAVICTLMNKVESGFYGADFNLFSEYMGGYTEAGFPDLLDCVSRGDLGALAQQVTELDDRMRSWLTNRSIGLNILENEEALHSFLDQRDPI